MSPVVRATQWRRKMISWVGWGAEGGDKKWAVQGDFLGHDYIVLYVVYMHAGYLT